MKESETKESPVVALVRVIWDHANGARGHSWTQLNGNLRAALLLAIRAGIKFRANDIAEIDRRFRGSRWLGGDVERLYAVAAAPIREHPDAYGGADNASACVALERYFGRPPFMYDGHRLYVGAEIPWHADDGRLYEPGERTPNVRHDELCVEVTSISGDHVIACKYAPPTYVTCSHCGLSKRDYDNEPHPRRPLKRIKITLEALRARERARLKAQRRALAARKEAELADSHDRGYHEYNKRKGCPKCA